MRKFLLYGLTLGMLISCKKEDDPVTPDVPKTSYSFENIDISGQQARILMLNELSAYAKSGNTQGVTVSAQQLRDMFANNGYNWQHSDLQGVTKDLRSKTYQNAVSPLEAWMDTLQLISSSTQTGGPGVSGRITSQDGTKTYLFTSKGFEPAQVIEKGLMGACFYYQATTVYLGDDKMNVDNSTVIVNEGTAMQHHWDEAFGYLGVPVGYPDVQGDLYFWGKYKSKASLIGADVELVKALIEGREAINEKDYSTRDQARERVRSQWELVCVSSALHYLNEVKANLSDDALRNHMLSEAYAFVFSLQFNIERNISNADWQTVMDAFGDDLYQMNLSDIDQAIDVLANAYGLENEKNQF